MSKNIILFGNEPYEQLSISLIESFDRLSDEYTFYYYTIGFDSKYNKNNVKKIKFEFIENMPHMQLYKPLVFLHALNTLDHFIYFDSDIIASSNFNYDNLLQSVNKYPKGVYINGWDDPHWWYYDDNNRYRSFNYEALMKYMNVTNKTQKWASCCIVAVNKSCKDFINKWVEICLNKELWCLNERPIYKNAAFCIQAWQKYFIVGEETPYNLMLWKDNVTNYFYENIILEPKKIESFIDCETKIITDKQLEENAVATYCKDSRLIVGYHQLKDISFRKKVLNELNKLKNKKTNNLKFGIYTSFYNAERFIDYIFDEVSKINYDNWEWIITDDYSKDNTKALLLDKVKKYKNVKYVEQSHKKEMYWQPNKFFDKSFDYVVLLDCDDAFDYDFLNVYNRFAKKYPDAVLLTSDFIKTQNNNLHSLSLVKNDNTIIEKLKTFHPQTDYFKNIAYNTLGHLRCFKNLSYLNFDINDFDACAEDSYRVMYMNSLGKWFHIPRCLYDWKLRLDSESHSTVKDNFNGNFDLAYQKIKNNCYLPYFDYDDVYEITSAISILGLNNIKNKCLSICSNYLNQDKRNKLQFLYSESKLIFNEYENADYYIFIYNDYINYNSLKDIFAKIKKDNSTIILYYLEDNIFNDKKNLTDYINTNIEIIKNKLSPLSYNYFLYFRHNYFTL